MAIRNIFQEGEQVLRDIAKPVSVFDERLHILLDDMKETMIKANGCGLAAPQVGIRKRAFVLEYNNIYKEMINPEILSTEGEEIAGEGCLSVDHSKDCKVKRPHKLTVAYQDRNGNQQKEEIEGFMARIVCHEYDHLDGILFIDKKYSD